MGRSDSVLDWYLRGARLSSQKARKEFWTKKIKPSRRLQEIYIRFSLRVPVGRKVVFYESMSGDRVGDNPFAIFERLMTHPRFSKYLHVWSLNDPANAPVKYKNLPNVVFVPRSTRAYAYFLAMSGHVICNANLPGFFTRRTGQRYLNTWHGIPYKAVGRDTPKARFGAPTSTGSFQKATHVITPCQFMTEAMMSAYSMTGVTTAVIAETGYPRVDLTVRPEANKLAELRRILRIPERNGNDRVPVVLYAPTWRSEGAEDVVDTDQLLGDLKALSGLDVQLLYRGHHRMDRIIRDSAVADEIGHVTIPPHEISSNELLTVVDILITDYSSIFFDFLPTGRPIVHYLYDLEDYQRTRGLNLSADELPGAVARSREELAESVEACVAALGGGKSLAAGEPVQGKRYADAQKRFCPHEDGSASERAIRFFFNTGSVDVPIRACRDGRPTVVYWAGFSASADETREFWGSVIASGRQPESQTSLVVERNMAVDGESLKTMRSLGTDLSAISFNQGEPVLLPREKAAYEGLVSRENLSAAEIARILAGDPTLLKVFRREYRRRMDDAQFDEVVLAPWLTNAEKAMAYFADAKHALEPEPKPTGGNMIRRTVNSLLPRGSGRREEIARTVWSVRRRVSR